MHDVPSPFVHVQLISKPLPPPASVPDLLSAPPTTLGNWTWANNTPTTFRTHPPLDVAVAVAVAVAVVRFKRMPVESTDPTALDQQQPVHPTFSTVTDHVFVCCIPVLAVRLVPSRSPPSPVSSSLLVTATRNSLLLPPTMCHPPDNADGLIGGCGGGGGDGGGGCGVGSGGKAGPAFGSGLTHIVTNVWFTQRF